MTKMKKSIKKKQIKNSLIEPMIYKLNDKNCLSNYNPRPESKQMIKQSQIIYELCQKRNDKIRSSSNVSIEYNNLPKSNLGQLNLNQNNQKNSTNLINYAESNRIDILENLTELKNKLNDVSIINRFGFLFICTCFVFLNFFSNQISLQ